ncbi:hypothetical protein [Phaeobacter piscinae]|uniref:hypothetical protein n=2 Tax=Phaeobacter TaxID=302485 RepID=UPI000F493A48|nr:hypothetical protein [Phaeobacter piscinae]
MKLERQGPNLIAVDLSEEVKKTAAISNHIESLTKQISVWKEELAGLNGEIRIYAGESSTNLEDVTDRRIAELRHIISVTSNLAEQLNRFLSPQTE